jgi:Dolichyl-phosphate-mannose-protein mannosyltransferase
MDVHPPLAKMLIALTGWVAGFDGEFDFKDIGKCVSPLDRNFAILMWKGLSCSGCSVHCDEVVTWYPWRVGCSDHLFDSSRKWMYSDDFSPRRRVDHL